MHKSCKIISLMLYILIFASAAFIATLSSSSSTGGIAYADSATSAASMALLEVTTGRVLYQKNPNVKRPMASTTKVVTAITVLENAKAADIVTVDKRAVGVEGSSIYLEAGEKLSVLDLLYGLMLQSGNDAATALAIHTAGSVEAFAALMNKTAQKAGAINSNFTNPHGLHNDNHYTTAHDLALITCFAMKNPLFKDIVSTKIHKAPWANRDYGRVIVNKNKLLSTYSGCDGVKTGFTKKAGRCYVSSATRDNMQVVCVVLNCGPMFEDCARLMDAAFSEYKMTTVLEPHNYIGEIPVVNSKKTAVKVCTQSECNYPLKADEQYSIFKKYDIPSSLTAPVPRNTAVGNIKIYLGNQLLFTEKIYTIEDVKKLSIQDYLDDIIGQWTHKGISSHENK